MSVSFGRLQVLQCSVGLSGYAVTLNNTKQSVEQWCPYGVPLTTLLQTQSSVGVAAQDSTHLSIPKAFVDIHSSPAYAAVVSQRKKCAQSDQYQNPGPIQYSGVTADLCTRSLSLGTAKTPNYINTLLKYEAALSAVHEMCLPGASAVVLSAATTNLTALAETLETLQQNLD